MKRNRLLDAFLALVLVLLVLPAAAESPEFLRIDRGPDGAPRALQVAVAEYRAQDGTVLDLVGAVHVADADYFLALNESFGDYDVVLYELVGDPDAARAAPEQRGTSAVGFLQGGMKDVLGLAYQLDEVDYDRDHFVHADMTADEFSASMDERNESFLQMLWRAWITGLARQTPEQAAAAQADLLKILFADDRQQALKTMFAEQLATQTDLIDAMAGPDSTLIVQRNLKALEVLERERAAGHRRIALFYGAGHFPDFHQRLTGEMGYESVGLSWLDAWRLD
jgi:hypothetical protein